MKDTDITFIVDPTITEEEAWAWARAIASTQVQYVSFTTSDKRPETTEDARVRYTFTVRYRRNYP